MKKLSLLWLALLFVPMLIVSSSSCSGGGGDDQGKTIRHILFLELLSHRSYLAEKNSIKFEDEKWVHYYSGPRWGGEIVQERVDLLNSNLDEIRRLEETLSPEQKGRLGGLREERNKKREEQRGEELRRLRDKKRDEDEREQKNRELKERKSKEREEQRRLEKQQLKEDMLVVGRGVALLLAGYGAWNNRVAIKSFAKKSLSWLGKAATSAVARL